MLLSLHLRSVTFAGVRQRAVVECGRKEGKIPAMGRQYQRLSNVNRFAKLSKTAGMHPDGDGLYLCVSFNPELASWIFRFKIDGRGGEMGLGSLRDVTLDEAREKAAEARKLKKQGINPIAAKAAAEAAKAAEQAQEAARAVTFEECARAFINSHKPSWRNAKARPAMAEHPIYLRLSGDRNPAGGRCRYGPRYAHPGAAVDGKAGDDEPSAGQDREHSGLGKDPRLPRR